MKVFKSQAGNNRILYRMMAVFSLICAIVIIVLSTVMYFLFSSEVRKEIYQSQEQSLRQISNTVSFRAEYVNSLMVQVKQNKQTSKLFYTTEAAEIKEALDRIGELRASVKQLNSIYIYNEYEDRIYYSGENGLSAFSDRQTFNDKGFVEILEHAGDYPKYTPFLRQLSIEGSVGREYVTYVYTYLVYDVYSSGAIRDIMAFNFHLGWMEDALEFIGTGQETSEELWIVDSNRQIVYTSTGDRIGSTVDIDELPDDIFEKESGYEILGKGDDRQMLVYATPSTRGYDEWTFISWNNYAKLVEHLEDVRILVYIICGSVLVISLFVIGRCSRIIYEPVRHTIDRVKLLEKEQEKKQKIDQMYFLRKLFVGDIPDDIHVIEEHFKKHRIEGNLEDDVRIIAVSIDYINSFLRVYGKDQEETSQAIETLIIKEFKKAYVNLLCVKMQNGLWAVCVFGGQNDFEGAALFESLNAVLKEKLDISVSMAVSDLGHSVRDIPHLYSEALNIYSYRFLWGQKRLITFEDIQKQGQLKFEYPNEISKTLLNHLFNGKYEETIETYEEFVSAVRWYTIDEMRLSFLMLAYSIKSASEKTMAETSSILLEFDKFYKRLQTVETIDEVHNMYYNLFEEITDKLKIYSKERHAMLIGQIKDYVKENYGNLSLSMNQVSDYVNMSAAYLGRLFKQVTGITFTEYLTKFRLDKACSLLKDTDMTVNEISDAVGFTNSSYFYIIFKKNMECTPNQYRKQRENHE